MPRISPRNEMLRRERCLSANESLAGIFYFRAREISGPSDENIKTSEMSPRAPLIFPDTPKTLLDRLQQGGRTPAWEASWEEFFDLYHQVVRWCVLGSFRRRGWRTVDDHTLQDVVVEVFSAIVRGRSRYDPDKGRFRQWLSGVCSYRVADYIRRHARAHPDAAALLVESSDNEAGLREQREREARAFRTALLGMLLAELRAEIPPRVHLIFEAVKLAGHSPAEVARQFGISRGVVDNSVYKAMQKLREIAARPQMAREFDL